MAMEFSRKQLEYIQNANHRWNVKCGATGAGKTFIDSIYVIPQRILERRKNRGLCVIMGVTEATIERNVLEPMRELYGDLIGNINNKNICRIFGEKVYCLGGEKISQVSKIQGPNFKYLYCDEVAKWNEEVFNFVKNRLRTPVSCADLTCNPEHPEHFFKKFLDNKELDIYYQHYVIDDNPFYPVFAKEELKKEYAGTVYYDRYILGEWVRAEGLVFSNFNHFKHVVDERKMPHATHKKTFNAPYEKYYVSGDYGTKNPTALLLWGLRGGVYYCIDEYYYDGKKNAPRTDDEHYEALEELLKRNNVKDVVTIILDPSAASFITLIQRKKRFSVTLADNAVLDGIRETITALHRNILMFSTRCVNTISEFKIYSWNDKTKEDEVIKEHDHSMDAVRYFVRTLKLARFQNK